MQMKDIYRSFLGDDPATDFRGMGLLGLQQLLFYAQFDVESCLRVFSLALHPAIGFPFAIAGFLNTNLLVPSFLCFFTEHFSTKALKFHYRTNQKIGVLNIVW